MKLILIILLSLNSPTALAEANASKPYQLPKFREIMRVTGERYLNLIEKQLVPYFLKTEKLDFEYFLNSTLITSEPSSIYVANLASVFPFEGGQEMAADNIRSVLQEAIRNNEHTNLLINTSTDFYFADKFNNQEKFSESTQILYGLGLLWGVKLDYWGFPQDKELQSEKVYSIIESIGGRNEIKIGERVWISGSRQIGSYLIRYQKNKNPIDFYRLYYGLLSRYQTVLPLIKTAQEDPVPDYTKTTDEQLIRLLKLSAEALRILSTEGTYQNTVLSTANTFIDVLGIRAKGSGNTFSGIYSDLAYIRDLNKQYGRNSVVDVINETRLRLLIESDELLNSRIEKALLKVYDKIVGAKSPVENALRSLFGLFASTLLILFSISLYEQRILIRDKIKARDIKSASALFFSGLASSTVDGLKVATIRDSQRTDKILVREGLFILYFFFYSLVFSSIAGFLMRHI